MTKLYPEIIWGLKQWKQAKAGTHRFMQDADTKPIKVKESTK